MTHSRRNRGSTLLLVLAMLSILFLIGAALAYTTRLEGLATYNYGYQTQARIAAATGLPTAAPLMAAASAGLTSTLQPWATAPLAFNQFARGLRNEKSSFAAADWLAVRKAGLDLEMMPNGQLHGTPQALFTISDLSGRINLNSIRSEDALERLLKNIFPSGNARMRADALFELGGTDDRSTGSGRMDLRKPETGDQQRIRSLAQLRGSPQAGGILFTNEELRTLCGFVTVFSQSPEAFNQPDGPSIPKLPLKNLTPEKALDVLRSAFPEKEDALLIQYAANLADFADTDDTPTVFNQLGELQTGTLAQPSGSILGVEQTPLITEVYPDAVTRVTSGDDGQFVEISNPWGKPLDLTGWRLIVSGGAGTSLQGVLLPGARLVVTDNYDQPSEESPPEAGSLLSIFGARKDDVLRRVQVDSSLNIPDSSSYAALAHPSGRVADVFQYSGAGSLDGRISHQRDDPRVRVSKPALATPFEAKLDSPDGERIADAWKNGNQELNNTGQLFVVSTAYGSAAAGTTGFSEHPWQKPLFTASGETSTETGATNLDIRLVDLFTSAVPEEDETSGTANTQRAKKIARSSRARGALSAAEEEPETTSAMVYVYGKLNLNTCAKVALFGLELKHQGLDIVDNSFVEKFEALRLKRMAEKKPPFYNVSDFLIGCFPKLTKEDLDLVLQVTEQTTVGSSSYEVIAENRVSPEEAAAVAGEGKNVKQQRISSRPAIARLKWHVAIDKAPYSLLSYSATP